MPIHLIVRHSFADYAKGDVITDAKKVAAYRAGHESVHSVAIAVPEADEEMPPLVEHEAAKE